MNNKLILGIVGGVLGLALIVAIAVSAVSGGAGGDDSIAHGEVTVEGDVLPFIGDNAAQDVAIGSTAPTVSGVDPEGQPISIGPDGRPKVLVLLAHWCQFCQAEVPEIVDWLEAGGQPDGVDFYSISTQAQRLRGNWPPQEWLADEGWTVPLMLDDATSSASVAYGMRGTPFWVVLDGDNNVVARVPGQVGIQGVTEIFNAAASA